MASKQRSLAKAMIFRQLIDPVSSTYTYLLGCEKTRQACLIDSVKTQLPTYCQLLEELDLTLTLCLDTHVHADHITGLAELKRHTGCAIFMSQESGVSCPDTTFADGDVISCGELQIIAIHTPGHTDDSYCFKVNDCLFTGDTLLIRGTGRTDFQNGDAGQQYDSIFQKLFTLPDNTKVFPGHDYKGWTQSSVGEEKAFNPRLTVGTKDAYVKLMSNLNLAKPKMIDVAVPANLHCGK